MQKSARENPSSFRLGPELDAEIDRLARELDIPRSQVVRKAIKLFSARQNHISAVLAEARESYAKYRSTGMGLPWEEASAWLRSGARKEDRPELRDMRR